VDALLAKIQDSPELGAVASAVAAGARCVHVDGIAAPAKAPVLAALQSALGRQILVVCPTEDQADKLHLDLLNSVPAGELRLFPSIEAALYEMVGVDREVAGDRLATLGDLVTGRARIVVTSASALLPGIVPREALASRIHRLRTGSEYPLSDLISLLANSGYARAELTTEPGDFSVRGGIVDLFPPTSDSPIRIEFFGDDVDSIRFFDAASQRSHTPADDVTIGPATELLASDELRQKAARVLEGLLEREAARLADEGETRAAAKLDTTVREHIDALASGRAAHGLEYYLPLLYEARHTLVDYLADGALIVVDEPLRMKAQCEELLVELEALHETRVRSGELLRLEAPIFRDFDQLVELLAQRQTVYLTLLSPAIPWAPKLARVDVVSSSAESFRGDLDLLTRSLEDWQASAQAIVLVTSQKKRLHELLKLRNVAPIREYRPDEHLERRAVHIGHLPVQAGFKIPSAGLVVLADREIFGWQRAVVPRRRSRDEVQLTSLADLHVGDLVVHINHGIGRYTGIVKKTIEGVERDYLEIQYAGEDRLYVPTPQIDRVQKYVGPEGAVATLHGLNDPRWARTRKKVQQAAEELARDLLRLYATRDQAMGHAFSPDQPWQVEVEDAFIYDETPDQLGAIRDIKQDMETPKPMDRLLCGDVGYGKTEVAVRAALKCVLDGKQAAVLVPTTVLAQQHLSTFQERLGAYPIAVELLSRFRTREQQRRTVDRLASGEVDIVVGTHRLLSKDIAFRDLGLLVIDEEQRFGVRHKESIKQLREAVDVLTMTATPIPRTLHMSLAGIRDMSLINDPPQGRVAIRTFCIQEDDNVIREAIERELGREGQVYFVHNRVQSIYHIAQRLKKLVPEARICVGHGQMHEDDLEQAMIDFYAGDYDVLVCTTIIENGLDVPNVNTIIVHDADRFGLAQLYQLRGRVGRSSRQAYAYFLYRKPEALTPDAQDRLAALKEFTELGSGLKIAMRDLEIRGTGNLLGPEQHGYIEAVGFELYCQMLSEAVRQLKGEAVDRRELPAVELPLDAYIPEGYVQIEGHRLDLYRRISLVRDTGALRQIEEEMVDRFGALPPEAENLMRVLSFRLTCAERGITQVTVESGAVVLRVADDRAVTLKSKRVIAKYALMHRRQTLRDVVVERRRVVVRFMNIPMAERLRALDELVQLVLTGAADGLGSPSPVSRQGRAAGAPARPLRRT